MNSIPMPIDLSWPLVSTALAVALASPPLAVFDSSEGQIEARFVPPRYAAGELVLPQLAFTGPGRAKALRVRFGIGGPYAVALWQISVAGLPEPTVAAVSFWLAADRVVIEPALVAPIERESRELVPSHPDLAAPGAACLHPAVDGRAPVLTTLRWTGGHCVMCWPKPFVMTRYEFDGRSFRKKWEFTTSRAFDDDARAVVSHYGVPCDIELVAASEDHFVKSGEITEGATKK